MKCRICGGHMAVWGKQGAYDVLQCQVCGLGVTFPVPSEGQRAECNRDLYEVSGRAGIYESRRSELSGRYAAYIARIKRFKKSGAMLDIGCSTGAFLVTARREGFSVRGVEMNSDCAAYGARHYELDIRGGSLEGAAFPSESFDVVTMFDVLEHVRDMEMFLSEVRRILKPDGLLVVQSPNLDSVMARLLGERWAWLTLPDHLYHFTPEAVSRLLEGSGFRLAALRTWEPSGAVAANIYSGFQATGVVGRSFRKLIWLAGLTLAPLFQRLWWGLGKGGLVEVYALKEGNAP